MSGCRTVRLGDVCKQDRATVKPGERADLRYIGLESIEANTGRFNEGELSKTPEVPQANSFRFTAEHVLYGKLRPYRTLKPGGQLLIYHPAAENDLARFVAGLEKLGFASVQHGQVYKWHHVWAIKRGRQVDSDAEVGF